MSFDNFQTEHAPAQLVKHKQTVSNWGQDSAGWLCLTGLTGVGKTHLAVAAANLYRANGGSVWYDAVANLLSELRTAAGAEALSQAVDLLFAVRPNSSTGDFQPLSDAYDRYLQADAPDAVPADAAISTGQADVDEIIIGLRPSDLIILGSRPGFGKSSLAFNMSVAAAKAGHTCGIFSLDMSFQR